MPRNSLLAVVVLIAATLALPTRLCAAEPAVDPMVTARDLLIALQWNRAYTAFSDIAKTEVAKDPHGERWAQATYGAAVANSHGQPVSQERTDQSIALYRSLLKEAPTSKYAARSMMNLGRLLELRDYPGDEPNLDGARELYLKVAATWPAEPIASEATLRAASTLVQAYDAPKFEKVNQGVAMMEKWIADHPKDPYAAVMWQYLGDTYFNPLKDDVKALAAYDKVDAIGWTDQGNQGPLLWRCANIAERSGNKSRAIYYYTKVITDTPNSGKGYESGQALERLGAPAPDISLFRKSKPATTQPAEGGAK